MATDEKQITEAWQARHDDIFPRHSREECPPVAQSFAASLE
jgi:hypothetical protein